jgi:TatD DNase family protein
MKYFDVHTHIPDESGEVKSVLNLFPEDELTGEMFSVGVHPWFTNKLDVERQLKLLRQKAVSENCVAIGECGLDRPAFCRSGDGSSEDAVTRGFDFQSELFKKQVGIANLADKPLLIHCVRAFPELLHIRKSIPHSTPWIIHGFRGSKEIADSLIKEGIYMSFGKSISDTAPSNRKIQELFRKLPDSVILLETDNVDEPTLDIRDVYRAASKIRGISISDLQEIIQSNIKRIFSAEF